MAKIALIVQSFPKISETFILNQVIGLTNRGHEVDIYAASKTDEGTVHDSVKQYDLIEKTIYYGPPDNKVARVVSALPLLHTVFKNNPKLLLDSLNFYKYGTESLSLVNLYKISAFLPQLNKYDAVHAHFGPVGEASAFIAPYVDAPFVVSFYGSDANSSLKQDPTRYENLFRLADSVTVLDEGMRRQMKHAGCPTQKIEKQPLGINTSNFEYQEHTRSQSKEYRIVTAARLVEKKGLRYAVDAISELSEKHQIKFDIIGDGPLRNNLEQRIQERNLEETIEILGMMKLTEMKRIMDKSQLFIMPCITDSSGDKSPTPTVLLQAQSMGLPVISTYHAGIPEIVEDGESGVLVPEKDSTALAAALEELLENPDKRLSMGKVGRQLVEDTHSISAMVDRLEHIYFE